MLGERGTMASTVEIPGQAIDTSKQDVLDPLQKLLTGINVLGSSTDSTGGAFSTPAQSVAIIESGATSLTKWWTGAAGALGGATAIAAAVTRFWNGQQGGTRIALIATTGAVIAAVAIALAIIIASDVSGRAAGAVAVYEARRSVAEKFLGVAYAASHQPGHPAGDGSGPSSPSGAVPAAASSGGSPIDSKVALITIAGLQQIPNAPKVTVTTDTGVTGTLKGVFLGSSGGAASEVQVNVLDPVSNSVKAIPIGSVTGFE